MNSLFAALAGAVDATGRPGRAIATAVVAAMLRLLDTRRPPPPRAVQSCCRPARAETS